jgi:hypothetical protein
MGLLDSLFGNDAYNYTGEDGPAGTPVKGLLSGFMSDPKKLSQLAAFGQALAQAGAPSRTGNHWGLAIANGLAGSQQAGQQFDQNKIASAMQQLQLDQMRQTLNQKVDPLAQFGKIDPKDYTSESIQKFLLTRNPADLSPRSKKEIAPSGEVFDPYNPTSKNYGAVRDVNMGGSQMFMLPNGQTIGSLNRSQSPDSIASNQVTMRGQNMTDERARELNAINLQNATQKVQETPNGPVLINTRNGQAMPVMMGGAPMRGDSAMKRESSANRVLTLLGEAEKLIPDSTGSVVGRGVDLGAGAFGIATPGATNTAKLSTIEGQLVAEMPRMEGPQSDKDVALYRQAAGEISNPFKPAKIRQEALQTLRELQKKYATPTQAAPVANAPAGVLVVDW